MSTDIKRIRELAEQSYDSDRDYLKARFDLAMMGRDIVAICQELSSAREVAEATHGYFTCLNEDRHLARVRLGKAMDAYHSVAMGVKP